MELIKNNKVVAAILAALIAGLTAFSTGLFGGDSAETPNEEKPAETAPVAPEAAPAAEATATPVTETAPAVEGTPADAAAATPAVVETKP